MKSLERRFLGRVVISQSFVRTIRQLGEHKGRQELFKEQSPQVLETLRQAALIQSTESSNRIEGVTAPPERIRKLVARKTRPRNRSEQEIAGYRDVLAAIHSGHDSIRLDTHTVLALHRDLFKRVPGQGGAWKSKDNTIIEVHPDGRRVVRFEPVSARQTPAAMDRLHGLFTEAWEADEVEPLMLIGAYVLDFLCIHPFADGNGRMARLLTLLLLYKAGYEVGRYISLERVVEETRASYYETLHRSSQDWHRGRHDIVPWLDYFLSVMLTGAYEEFERRAGLVTGGRGGKTALVLDVLERMLGEFSVRDVQERSPGVGLDLIRRIMHRERLADRLQCLGRGPDARWRRK